MRHIFIIRRPQCAVVVGCLLACLAAPALAAERMRAGQWEGTTTLPDGKVIPNSSCVSASDATAMNGDAKSVQAFLETVIPPAICKLSNVKASGDQIVYSSACGAAKETVITTNYHGTSSEALSSGGTKTVAKWTGACK
jgi:hypothetical protein